MPYGSQAEVFQLLVLTGMDESVIISALKVSGAKVTFATQCRALGGTMLLISPTLLPSPFLSDLSKALFRQIKHMHTLLGIFLYKV